MRKSYIKSLGFYVPPKVVTNFDLEKIMETSDEWIQQRSGIRERRWAEPGETCTHMALEASKDALKKAKLTADDIDCIVFGSLITDYIFPGGGCQLQEALGCKKPIPAFDIRNQCTAWPYSLQMTDALIKSGTYNRILIVGCELVSTSLDKTTRGRDIGVLFGDGAAAAVVEVAPEGSKSFVIDSIIHSEGAGCQFLMIKKPTPMDHPRLSEKSVIDADFYPKMEGKAVFKNAVTRMCEVTMTILAKNGFKLTGIDISETAIAKLNLIIKDLNLEIETIVSKIEDYKFFEKYDCIISTTVIHLLSKKDQLECIQKMKDFTLNGGYNLITVFTKKDPGFIEYPNLSFINLEELQNYYNDKNWSILVADEYIKHETHGVPHDHSIAVLMARKNT
jgi:3-oxoacyl-[acyl-carrier-protein] synthase-3